MIAKIREVNFSDQEQVAMLQAKYGIQPDSIEDWYRLWRDNPEFTTNSPMGWVLEHNDSIVGYLGNVPLLYYYQNTKIFARSSRGWVVEKNFRSQATHLALKYLSQKNVDILINSSSNEPAFNLFKSIGCIAPKGIDFSCSILWIISPIKFAEAVLLRSRISKRFHIIFIFFIGIIFLAIKILSLFYIASTQLYYKLKFADYKVKEVDPSLNEFNCLFLSMLEDNIGFFADRSARKLSWFTCRKNKQLTVLGCYVNDMLSGYMILRKNNIFGTNIPKVELIDYIAINSNSLMMKFMLIKALQLANEKNVAFFEINPATKFVICSSKGLLPIKRSRFSTPFTFKILNKEKMPNDSVYDLGWNLITNYDGDSSL